MSLMVHRNHDSNRRTVAIFDLDGTLTSKDTYLAILGMALISHPHRILGCWVLPFGVFLHKFHLRSNSWLKQLFLTRLMGRMNRSHERVLVDNFVSRVIARGLVSDGLEMLDRHRKSGDTLVLATASFDFYVGELAKRLGFDHLICSVAQRDNEGRLTGAIEGNNCYGVEKLAQVKAYVEDQQDNVSIVAYSDHHSDLELLTWADCGFAVNPKRKLGILSGEENIPVLTWN